eukprot:scaffold7830_cov80-Skeletonema_dohrnii-CCMP3373.AAC.1
MKFTKNINISSPVGLLMPPGRTSRPDDEHLNYYRCVLHHAVCERRCHIISTVASIVYLQNRLLQYVERQYHLYQSSFLHIE